MNFEGSGLDDTIPGLLPPSAHVAPMARPPSPQPASRQIKRPHNAYNLYFIERLPIEKDLNPTLSGNEVSHLIGKKWSELDDESRRPYREKALEIKEKFREENPDYHYQKTHDRHKRQKSRTGQIMGIVQEAPLFAPVPENIDGQQKVELQIRNLLTFLGSQAVTQHMLNSKALVDDMAVVFKNFARIVGNGTGLDEPLDLQ